MNSLNDKAKTLAHALEQMMKLIEQTLGTQEERVHKLEAQLKEKSEAVSKLESRIAGLEQILQRPAKEETVREEPIKEETAKEEPEKQPMEVTVQTVASGTQPQTEEIEERQKEDKKRKRFL